MSYIPMSERVAVISSSLLFPSCSIIFVFRYPNTMIANYQGRCAVFQTIFSMEEALSGTR